MLCFLNTGHVIYNTLQCVGKRFFPILSYLRAYLPMNRNWVKFPWNLYWENKTYKLKGLFNTSISPFVHSVEFIPDGEKSTLCDS